MTASPTAATSHHAARRVVHARQAPATAIAEESAMRFGFQMKVDSSTALAETAIRKPAIKPAIGPPIERATHHVTATAATPESAISPTTHVGSPPPSHAAGASR